MLCIEDVCLKFKIKFKICPFSYSLNVTLIKFHDWSWIILNTRMNQIIVRKIDRQTRKESACVCVCVCVCLWEREREKESVWAGNDDSLCSRFQSQLVVLCGWLTNFSKKLGLQFDHTFSPHPRQKFLSKQNTPFSMHVSPKELILDSSTLNYKMVQFRDY